MDVIQRQKQTCLMETAKQTFGIFLLLFLALSKNTKATKNNPVAADQTLLLVLDSLMHREKQDKHGHKVLYIQIFVETEAAF